MARKRRPRRRRRGSGFLYRLLTVLTISAVIVVALTLFFKVETIVVEGNVRYTEDEIREASGVSPGDNLFLLNRSAISQRMTEQLPYLETVRPLPKLPDTLLIEVTECASTYAIPQEGVVWVISGAGKLVGTAQETGDLPVIDGCELLAPSVGSHMALATEFHTRQESLLSLLSALDEAEAVEQVDAIHLDNPATLVMDYAGRFSVVMPYGADYGKLLRFVDEAMARLESNETGIIDLTIEGEAHIRQK